MKHQLIIALFLIYNSNVMTQTLDYYPIQNPNITDADYKYGTTILKETYSQIKKNDGELNYVNYWNLAVAYMTLEESDIALVRFFLKKSRSLNVYNFSSIFIDSSKGVNIWIGFLEDDEFFEIYSESKNYLESNQKPSFTLDHSEDVAGVFDLELQNLIKSINENDQRYRKSSTLDLKKQKLLDEDNLKIIDSLCDQYGGYIGKSLVGEKYAHVMWSVIQHSNLESMEKYLPEVSEAVNKKDLKEGALKMLVDRVFSLKYNYQIFGSQMGVEIAPNEILKQVSQKYNISTSEVEPSKQNDVLIDSNLLHQPSKNNNTIKNKFPGL